MRTAVICMVGGVAALLLADYVAAGSSAARSASGQPASPQQEVVRNRKGDRLSRMAGPPPLEAATVNVTGRDGAAGAAIVYRDGPGRAPDSAPPQLRGRPEPPAQKPKLPVGCEPSYSPLTGAALSSLHARCIADLQRPLRIAALL
jgi:hypothetical protein